MSDNLDDQRDADGTADVIAATAIITVVVYAAYLWLAGMPT